MPLRLTVSTRATSAPACATEKATGLDQQAAIEVGQRLLNGRGVLRHLGCGVEAATVIVDAETAAGVDSLEHDAFALELLHQLAHPLHGLAKGLSGANLRADMDADAVRLEPAIPCGALVDAESLANVDAELVLAQAGGDVGMGVGKDVGVYAQRKARLRLSLRARAASSSSSASLSTLNSRMPDVEREVDLRGRLAYAGENHPAGSLGGGGQDALQLAAGDDVEARSAIGQAV